MKPESKLAQELRKSCEYIDKCFWHKIGDKQICTNKKPFDAILAINGTHYAIELKYHCDINNAWPMSSVKEHQVKRLLDAQLAGYQSEIWMQFNENELYCLPINRYLELRDEGLKSMNEKTIVSVAIVMLERKKINGVTRWDIDNL